MIIHSIYMNNWKCFDEKTFTFKNRVNALNMPNGTGKSSMIEAVIFCLFNKRPDAISSAKLIKDNKEDCTLKLLFTHKTDEYEIVRKIGSSSTIELYRNGSLIARTASDVQDIINKMMPENLVQGLWGHKSLAESPILKTEYIFNILSSEFEDALNLKKVFQADRTLAQRKISQLKDIDEAVTEEEVKSLKEDILRIEAEIKNKVFISDSEIIRARSYKEEYPEYAELKKKLETSTFVYDREKCLEVRGYVKNLPNQKAWDEYFSKVEKALRAEKSKVTHPLAKYNTNFVAALLDECEENHTCIVCGGKFKRPDITKLDSSKIEQLQGVLQHRDMNVTDLVKSINHWALVKKVADKAYLDSMDFEKVLREYDAHSKELYIELENKKKALEEKESHILQIQEKLKAKAEYDEAKENIQITEQYIKEAKDYYLAKIVEKASSTLSILNSRYEKIISTEGIYEVYVRNYETNELSVLPVQLLSLGEKTMVALSLILAIRDIFAEDMFLVFDEAFANLDADNLLRIKKVLHLDRGQWIVVSHDNELLSEFIKE